MNQQNIPELNLLECFEFTSYHKDYKDKILGDILDLLNSNSSNNHSNNNNNQSENTTPNIAYIINPDSILILDYTLHLNTYNTFLKTSSLKLLIYIPKNYPFIVDNIYFNKDYNNHILISCLDFINSNTLEIDLTKCNSTINTSLVNKLDSLRTKINSISSTNTKMHNIVYNNINNPEKCNLNKESIRFKVILEEKQVEKYNKKSVFENISIKNKVQFSDSNIQKLLIQELMPILKDKLKNKVTEYHKETVYLNEMYNKIQNYNNSYRNITNNKQIMLDSYDIIQKSNKKIMSLEIDLEYRENINITKSNLESFIMINFNNNLDVIVKEKNIEDIILIIKKAYEKNIMSLDECIGLNRKATRCIFKIRFSSMDMGMNNSNSMGIGI